LRAPRIPKRYTKKRKTDVAHNDTPDAAVSRSVTDTTDASPPWRRLYPFAPHYAELPDGVRMHYVDEGEGTPVVMLHGNPTWSFIYRDLIPDLVENGFRAIAVDHVGCGLSDKPQKYAYRLARHVENLSYLLDTVLDLPGAHLVLHDWGGAVGVGYALRDVRRIRSMVLMNTAAFILLHCPLRIRVARWPGIGEFGVRVCNGFVHASLRMASATPDKLSSAVREGYLAPYGTYHDRVAHLGFVRDIPLSRTHPTRPVLEGIQTGLPKLHDVPKLFCWGMRDFVFTEAFLEKWLQFFPDAPVRRFPEAGHFLLEDAGPEVIETIRGFLIAQHEAGDAEPVAEPGLSGQ